MSKENSNAAALLAAMKEIRDRAVAGVQDGVVDCHEIIEIAEQAMAAQAMKMHEEYAMQWCTYDINGNRSWWTLTEWSQNLEVVNAQWEKFANRNDPINPDLGHRLVKRIVSDPEIVEGGAE